MRGFLALILLICGMSPVAASEPTAARDFTLKVLPLLKAKCFGCHGDDPDDVKGDFDIRSRDSILQGGESGEASLVVGSPEQSPLYQAVRWEGLEMPPKENDRLTEQQTELLRDWILAGAPWPDEAAQRSHREAEARLAETPDGVLVRTSGGLSDEWTNRRYRPDDLWAFRPLQSMDVPEGTHPVDYFIDERLTTAGFRPAPLAQPRTLIRRASFDLTGLPPTPAAIEQFEADWKRNPESAWSELIDRLLDSPHYGERWAQHWLDITRYADTGGMANDFERSNMWRYRDYVIRAMNADKPFNRFFLEQIAGDQLADASALQRYGGDHDAVARARQHGDYTEEEAEWILATGFLRMGPWDNAMVKAPQARQIYRDDLVNAIGQTFLATTLRCVKCHDHKFDPIPTRDYYRIYAALAGTQMAERPLRFLSQENRDGFQRGQAFVERMLAFATEERIEIEQKREAAARAWFEQRGLEYVSHAERRGLPDEVKPPRHVGLDHADEGRLKVREQDEWIWTRRLERYQPMVQSVYDGPDVKYVWNGARKLRMPKEIDADWQPDTHILSGGALEAPGDPVRPGVLSAVGLVTASVSSDPHLLPEALPERRLALAKWIAHDQNPLTSRALANRIWQYHFGNPIAGTPNNFGAKGAKPTHPELLDWLAADLVSHGWKVKRLHRLIMSSRSYRQASGHPRVEELLQRDPYNRLLAYFPIRRLAAEEIRDAMLTVTGELNTAVGGLPVMPEMNMEVALQPRMIQFSLAPAYQPARTPAERNRRSIYIYRVRSQADPFLEVFNQPNPNDSCELRDSASVSPQAFTLLNSDLMTDRSIAFALRLQKEMKLPEQQVQRAFVLAFGRPPSMEERQRGVAYVDEMRRYHQNVQPPQVSYPTRVTRSLIEEFSGSAFEYEEILPVFERYVPDKKAADVEADTRALADLCLMLFNSNEFLYVD